jgi:pimeloyl-ACP methyl ester carboxylesterase
MERVEVDGIGIRLFRSGEGAPLIYLHSGFGELGALPFLEKLTRNGFSVVAPEMPGFGESNSCRDWHKIEDAVYFYRRLIDSLGLDSAAVVGQSLGGWVAAELAVWFPDKVGALVLVDAVGLYIDGAPIHELFGVDPVKLMPLVFPGGSNILEHIAPALEGRADSDSVLLHFFRAMETTAAIGWSPYMHDPKLRDRISSVKAPTLVIHGEKDGIVPLRHSEEYSSRIPNARLEVIPGMGHLPALEDPETVADLVVEFLRQTESK